MECRSGVRRHPRDSCCAVRDSPAVHDRHGRQILARVEKILAALDDLRGAIQHLGIEWREILRGERNQHCGVAAPKAEIALDNAAHVVLHRTMMASAVPLLQIAGRRAADVVYLADGHALVRQVEHLVGVIAPARPAVRGEHHLQTGTEAIQGLRNVFHPAQRISYLRAAKTCPFERIQHGRGAATPLRCYNGGTSCRPRQPTC